MHLPLLQIKNNVEFSSRIQTLLTPCVDNRGEFYLFGPCSKLPNNKDTENIIDAMMSGKPLGDVIDMYYTCIQPNDEPVITEKLLGYGITNPILKDAIAICLKGHNEFIFGIGYIDVSTNKKCYACFPKEMFFSAFECSRIYRGVSSLGANVPFTDYEKTIIRSSCSIDTYLSISFLDEDRHGETYLRHGFSYFKYKDTDEIEYLPLEAITGTYMNDIADCVDKEESITAIHLDTKGPIMDDDCRPLNMLNTFDMIDDGTTEGDDGMYHLKMRTYSFDYSHVISFECAFDENIKKRAESGEDIKELRHGFVINVL